MNYTTNNFSPNDVVITPNGAFRFVVSVICTPNGDECLLSRTRDGEWCIAHYAEYLRRA